MTLNGSCSYINIIIILRAYDKRARQWWRVPSKKSDVKPTGGTTGSAENWTLSRCQTRGARRLRMRGVPVTFRRRRRPAAATGRHTGVLRCARVFYTVSADRRTFHTRIRIRYLSGCVSRRRRLYVLLTGYRLFVFICYTRFNTYIVYNNNSIYIIYKYVVSAIFFFFFLFLKFFYIIFFVHRWKHILYSIPT